MSISTADPLPPFDPVVFSTDNYAVRLSGTHPLIYGELEIVQSGRKTSAEELQKCVNIVAKLYRKVLCMPESMVQQFLPKTVQAPPPAAYPEERLRMMRDTKKVMLTYLAYSRRHNTCPKQWGDLFLPAILLSRL